ncbi:hypothetical protein [Thermocrinis sp.]|jgi:hypothetical protein|uniref:hypothetical protein n=1 Tax=Thermocrinis sp. TaxID=2024383 RepID=UPI003C0070F1
MNIYIEELKKVLEQEEIDFRLVGKLLELAVGELYRELLLLLGEEIEKERQKRERGKAQTQEEEPIQEEDLPCPHFVRVGRPAGRKDAVPRMSLREFFEKEIIPLHKETDWEEKAREVRERILRGVFVIASLEDFIGYLYAYMLYEDVPDYFSSSSWASLRASSRIFS